MNKKIKLIISSILVAVSGVALFKFVTKDKSEDVTSSSSTIESAEIVKDESEEEVVEVMMDEVKTDSEEIKDGDEKVSSEPVVVTKKLVVDANKCVGCGRCVKTARENFAFNTDGKSTVISQENLDSEIVKKAIEKCPVGAISM